MDEFKKLEDYYYQVNKSDIDFKEFIYPTDDVLKYVRNIFPNKHNRVFIGPIQWERRRNYHNIVSSIDTRSYCVCISYKVNELWDGEIVYHNLGYLFPCGDEWFVYKHVWHDRVCMSDSYEYYKCDQLDGFKRLIEDLYDGNITGQKIIK